MAEADDGSVPVDSVYRWSPWRAVAVTVTLNGCVAVAAGAVAWLVPGNESWSWTDRVEGGVCLAGYVVALTVASVLFDSRRPPRIRFGAGDVELVAARRDGVLIPWSVVSRAQVRWVWPFSMLDVFVAEADEVKVTRLGRPGFRPSRRRKGTQVRFSMPTAGLKPSTGSLRVELRRR